MCGIFGFVNLGRPVTPDQIRLVEQGTAALQHRGPDGGEIVTEGQVCFGHRRLSIVDLEGGRQPMWTSDRRGLLTYNGEVYNFEALERELCALGRRFVTRSDTEAVINGYLAWGPDVVTRLRGMFAFAAVDFDRQQLLLARDRLGKKPLFYRVADGKLAWSSELEPLYRTFGPFPIDLEALDGYLSWQYIAAPRTIYQGVRCLPPGHVATVDLRSGAVEERRYWHLQFTEDRSLSIDEWGERLDAAIREAVRVRFMSDVPYGAFLSGGIDSSLIVGYMAELMEEPVRTFTIGFREREFSEVEFAEEVARLNRTQHETEIVDADALGLLPRLVRHYGQPFADSSAIPTYHVSRMASRHVKMVLSGDGGDENFAGYNSYEYVTRAMQGARTAAGGPRRWYRDLARLAYRRLRRGLHRQSWLDRVYTSQSETAHHFPPAARRQLWRAPFQHLVRDVDESRRRLLDLDDAPLVTRLQHLDLMAYLPYDILTKVDVAAMANSLEVRVPLLDHHVVELAATIPSEYKLAPLGGGEFDKKHLLKRLAKQRYPAALIDRPKMGFGVPMSQWIKAGGEIEARLIGSPHLARYFNIAAVQALCDEHRRNPGSSARLWNLLFLDEWLTTHEPALA
jgi:asparagine synthase (glutamine-hydrolysing)